MLGFDHDSHTLRPEFCCQAIRDLLRESLLHLWPAGGGKESPGKFRQAEDAFTRQVSHMRDTAERQQVVFTHRTNRNGFPDLAPSEMCIRDRHTAMLGFDHDSHTLRPEFCCQAIRDLLRESLLHLWPAGEELDDPGKFRQAEDAFTRQVSHMRDTAERQQVVFTHRTNRNGFGHHQLVIPFIVREGRQLEGARGKEIKVGPCHPAGCISNPAGAGIDPERVQKRPRSRLRSGQVRVPRITYAGRPAV
ncbi:hypothetical protein Pd630_LPD09178 (plasmid) [Rhodococcus opacus PD630]|nr:hypothetical protein Pd630_LPD09178 [Rhodococcus opacus PD630]